MPKFVLQDRYKTYPFGSYVKCCYDAQPTPCIPNPPKPCSYVLVKYRTGKTTHTGTYILRGPLKVIISNQIRIPALDLVQNKTKP
jgi:hypothetical protein